MSETQSTERPRAPPAPFEAIRLFGAQVRLGPQIGAGSQADVYEGRSEWGDKVAVKVFRPGIEDKFWRNEARQLRQFASRWVPHVYGATEHEGRGVIVMAHAGVTLSSLRLHTADARLRLTLHAARQLLQALHWLHSTRHQHGDVIPPNVMLNVARADEGAYRFGTVNLVDFTSCRKVTADSTTPGRMTVRVAHLFMPPEALDSALRATISGLDIYMLAALLWSTLAGRNPMKYSRDEVLAGRPAQDLAASGLPLAAILAPALSVVPSERPNALALWRSLRAETGAR